MKVIPKQFVACTGIAALSAMGLFAAVTPSQRTAARQDRFLTQIETVLAMTPTQRDQTQTAFQEARRSAEPIRQELMNTTKAIETAVRSNDTASIQRLSTTEGQEIGQLTAIRSEAAAKVYKSLTPDQRQRADALHELMLRGMGGRFEQQANRSAS